MTFFTVSGVNWVTVDPDVEETATGAQVLPSFVLNSIKGATRVRSSRQRRSVYQSGVCGSSRIRYSTCGSNCARSYARAVSLIAWARGEACPHAPL